MTDNSTESNLNKTQAKIDNINADHTNTWQLNALTTALGDLSLTVDDSLSVGRGSDNDVVLGSKEVSRNHAVLSVANAELYVKDLDSSNGTFINDERIESNKSTLVKAEDRLGFASFEFQVTSLTAESTETTKVDSTVESNNLEPEDIVGSVQENLETTNPNLVTDNNPVMESAVDASVSPVAIEETIIERPTTSVETMSADTVTQPVVKETVIGEVLAASAGATAMSAAAITENSSSSTAADLSNTDALSTAATEETLMANDKSQLTNEQSTTDQSLTADPVIREPRVADPVVKEPVIEQSINKKPSVAEPIVEENIADEELTYKKGDHQEVSPEHDKTTTTTLQEEADPDILRAKQAATSQFSGTANLGQGRDLGTTGNNAMDQAINNPANNAQGEKKASGGWFIWVFIAILIIAIALWLFNKGGV